MKVHFKHVWWILGFVAVIFCAYAALRLFRPPQGGPELVDQTRAKLRAEGFKIDLAEFDLSTPPDMRVRESILNATLPDPRNGLFQFPQLMEFDNDSAIVVWKRNGLNMPLGGARLSWDELGTALDSSKDNLDAACDAIFAGPIGFNLDTSEGNAIRLPHLQVLNLLTQTLGWRSMLALHNGDNNSAWTNLLAATRLVTAWKIEPAEYSYLVRSFQERAVFDATWQLLQTHRWQDGQLKQLQDEWESVNLLANLPELAAFKRAAGLAQYQMLQQEMIKGRPGFGLPPVGEVAREALRRPSSLWLFLRMRWRQNEFFHGAFYQEEADMLNYYSDLETALRKGTNASNWLQICAVPGITNEFDYMPQPGLLYGMPYRSAPRSRVRTDFLARLAEDEARRGILITAIALERYYEKHGAYPDALADLAPELVKEVPADFMNGQPLRYRRTDDGHFVLYSVGLVGTDDGGRVSFSDSPGEFAYGNDRVDPDGNIVWPPPVSQAAAQAQEAAEVNAQADKDDEQEETMATAQWEETARYQTEAAKLLAAPPQKVHEVNLDGMLLSSRLCNADTAGTNHLTLSQLLSLRQVITGQEPEVVTFKLPIQYDALNQIGRLVLLVDDYDNSENGGIAQHVDITEANDGDCLLAWNTIYESPGLHALQLDLFVNQLPPPNNDFRGPLSPYTVTNLCQFSLASSQFDPAVGAIFHAKLPEMNCKYAVELTTTNGAIIKHFTGTTSDGIIKFRWDLVGDNGTRFTNDEFNSIYHITLTDSGRSQTLRGP